MEKKLNIPRVQPNEERKLRPVARKDIKNKAPVFDPRRGSKLFVEAVTAVITDRAKNSREVEMISNALKRHFIFTSLSNDNRITVISQMKLYTMGSKEIVFEQNSPGSNFFVVATGKLDIFVNGKKVNSAGAGDSFGELALLHDTPRSASVYTTEKVTMWGLDRKTFRTAVKTVTAQNYKENKQFIDSVPLFSVLTATQKDSLVSSLSTLKFREGERIVKEGDPGDLFYMISEGKVLCSQAGVPVREMCRGDFFGEQALLYHTMRTATITALANVKCVAIGRNKLTSALGDQLQNIIYHNSQLIGFERSPVLSKLEKNQQIKVLERMRISVFADGRLVIPQGTGKRSRLYVVLNGALREEDTVIAEVFQCLGDTFMNGESSEVYMHEVYAVGNTVLAEITKTDFEICVGNRVQQLVWNSDAISALRNIQILRNLPLEKFDTLINRLKAASFGDGEVIIQQNTAGESFFLINTGKVDIVKDGANLRTVTKHDYFGERSLLFNDFRSASVIANGLVTCWYLTRADFFTIFEGAMINSLISRIDIQDDSITLKDLSLVKLLGKGMFGTVFLVIDKTKQRLYALKTISRAKIQRYEIQANILLEKKILLAMDHVFILKLVKTFKDADRVYLLTEFVNGSDLFDALRVLNLLYNRDSQFYTASLILILEYLHDRDIIYRDLKPENVMIDDQGYPKLIDFGISKIINGRTYTVVGTPHYMAPEVITGKGYSFPSDYWSLGIMLFEFMCGGAPFGDNEEDPYVIYEKILERRLVYPAFVEANMPAKPMIEQLLNKNPVLRNGGSVENLKAHSWFSGMDWDDLINKEVSPPYVPAGLDLTDDIQKALHTNVKLEDAILKEEKTTTDNDASNRRHKNVPENWDQDF